MKEKEIITLAKQLIRIPAISIGEKVNYRGIEKCYCFIVDYLKEADLRVIEFKNNGIFPGLYCDCGKGSSPLLGDLLLIGHYDRVSPYKQSQLVPKIDGNWLVGRGAADMLTVVATFMVFMKDIKIKNGKNRVGLLLVGNEEPGEFERWGTLHILNFLYKKFFYQPLFLIVGERTGDGEERIGKVEIKNRGLVRMKIKIKETPEHSALIKGSTVVEKIIQLIQDVKKLIPNSQDKDWFTSCVTSFFFAGEEDNFNTTPEQAVVGLEIRPTPEYDISKIISFIESQAPILNLDFHFINNERGILTRADNTYVQELLSTIAEINGGELQNYLGKGKLPATQARFVPAHCPCVIFGQSGIGPHTPYEKHYVPSILPYYKILNRFADFFIK